MPLPLLVLTHYLVEESPSAYHLPSNVKRAQYTDIGLKQWLTLTIEIQPNTSRYGQELDDLKNHPCLTSQTY